MLSYSYSGNKLKEINVTNIMKIINKNKLKEILILKMAHVIILMAQLLLIVLKLKIF